MLTKLIVRNFKRFADVQIDLGDAVVFIGPNNSGKTSALQALALWQVGLSRWREKRKGKGAPEKRPGVVINRRDVTALPIPDAKLLWRDLHVRDVRRTPQGQKTKNIRVEITVEGVTNGKAWECGLEFDYANEESFYCRPALLSDDSTKRMSVPDEACDVTVAFLPPMSGLASRETLLQPGAVNVLVGEGKTAEVLRNLCFLAAYVDEGRSPSSWPTIAQHIKGLFGVELEEAEYVAERGEIEMRYHERGVRLDLSSSGRGLQQTLLLLAYMYANPGSILLIDEPDAHLEILRQREIYRLLVDVARSNGNQLIAATHSDVLLSEAAGRDVVVAFVGIPHRIDDRGSQVAKALKDISFEDYYLAEQTGWILYLEGSTDLAMLQAFARRLGHAEAEAVLARPFVRYVGNQPMQVSRHFHGLQEAVPHLKGIALFDRLERELPADLGAIGLMWRKREIENYVCVPETLDAYARADAQGPLFQEAHAKAMAQAMGEIEDAMKKLAKGTPWDADTKASDDFLTPLFARYFDELKLPNLVAKRSFYELAYLVPPEKIDPEVSEKLDAIARVAHSARPAPETE